MRKIAIVRRNGLGDLLCTFPLVLYIQKFHPTDQITLFVDERNAPLIPFLPPVNASIVFPKKGNKYLSVLKIGYQQRKTQFDLAISAKTSPMKLMNLFMFALGAKKRIAYVDNHLHRFFINVPMKLKEKKRHQSLKTLQLINPDIKEVNEELFPRLQVSDFLHQEYPLEAKKGLEPILLLSASTTKKQSRFCAQKYAESVNQLYRTHPFEVKIVSMKKDEKRAADIAHFLKVPHTLHFPRNFDSFMVVLDSCSHYFVGDGGIAHIGAALGKKGVILFGQTDPVEWHPLSRKMISLSHPDHVDRIDQKQIEAALFKQLEETCERHDLPSGLGNNKS